MTTRRLAFNRWFACARAGSIAMAFVIAGTSSRALAQTVHGSVVDAGGQPVAGAVVMLLDTGSAVVARALSDANGGYRVRAPAAGSFRLRTLRIGYRPSTTEAFRLAASDDAARQLTVAGIPLGLDTMRVVDRSSCGNLGDSAVATFAVWEQVRAALTAAELTERSRSVSATTIVYDRVLRGNTKVVQSQRSLARTQTVSQPWLSATPAELRKSGYVVDSDDSTAYFAPGTSVLLSPEFVEDHCFKITKGSDPAKLGVEFSPTRSRRVGEIRGTLWLDRKTAELRSMDFGYVNIPSEQAEASGGEMDFARMRDGAWVISRWSIRMPVLVTVRVLGEQQTRIREVHVSGGQLAVAHRGADTLWASPPLVVVGTVSDSATGARVAGARVALEGTAIAATADANGRFRLEGVLLGEYMLGARTSSLDSIGAVSETSILVTDAAEPLTIRVPDAAQLAAALCRDDKIASAGSLTGLVVGDVRDPTSAVPPRTRVSAEWTHVVVHGDARWPEAQRLPHAYDTYTDAQGNFRLCGLPIGEDVTLRATTDSVRSAPLQLSLSRDVRFSRVELTLDHRLTPVAVFAGVVLADTTNQPLAGAEVALPEFGVAAMTNDRGVFRLTDIPVGEQQVQVRRVGYAPLEQRLAFGANQTVNKRILLERVVVLDSVRTTAVTSGISSFDAHKAVGLGHFMTRADLEKRETSNLSEVLEVIPGIQIVRGKGPISAVAKGRGPASIGQLMPGGSPDIDADGSRGLGPACYATVYVDGHKMYERNGGAGSGSFIFDVNSITVDQIQSIEYYAGPSETPAEYSGLNSTCGVLVIWMRHER